MANEKDTQKSTVTPVLTDKVRGIDDPAGTPATVTFLLSGIIDLIASLTGKTTPVDADTFPLSDSAESNFAKKVTWANIKATLKTYFDGYYGGAGYCLVNRGGVNQTGCTAGAVNKILFTTESADVNGWFDNATNYRYTPLLSGYYLVTLNVRAANNGDSIQPVINKNGAAYKTGFYLSTGAGTGELYIQTVGIVNMNGTTDYIEGAVYLPATITVINGSVGDTNMAIIKL